MFNSGRADLEVLQSRQKGKVSTWPHRQESNHAYVPVAQVSVRMLRMWIVKPWGGRRAWGGRGVHTMMELTGYGTLSNIQNKSNFHLLLVNFQFKIKFISLKLSNKLTCNFMFDSKIWYSRLQCHNVTMSHFPCHLPLNLAFSGLFEFALLLLQLNYSWRKK